MYVFNNGQFPWLFILGDFAHFCRIYRFKKKKKNPKIQKFGCGRAAGVEWPGMEWEAAPPHPIFAMFAFLRFFLKRKF